MIWCRQQVVVPGPAGATMQKDFSFHACLGPETSQADVMALCGIQQLLDAALAGYHVTIFAYGQTGVRPNDYSSRLVAGQCHRNRVCKGEHDYVRPCSPHSSYLTHSRVAPMAIYAKVYCRTTHLHVFHVANTTEHLGGEPSALCKAICAS